jgi:hypothetical protein
MQQAATRFADELEGIDPPGDVSELHARLTEQVRTLGGELERAEGAEPQAALDALSEAASMATGLDETISRINDELAG